MSFRSWFAREAVYDPPPPPRRHTANRPTVKLVPFDPPPWAHDISPRPATEDELAGWIDAAESRVEQEIRRPRPRVDWRTDLASSPVWRDAGKFATWLKTKEPLVGSQMEINVEEIIRYLARYEAEFRIYCIEHHISLGSKDG